MKIAASEILVPVLLILCFFSIAYHSRKVSQAQGSMGDVQIRVTALKERIVQYSKALVSPILYRSHMFNPISHATPSLVLDILNFPAVTRTWNRLAQTRIHLTLYHLTYRYDVDSDWMQRVHNLIPATPSQNESTLASASARNSSKQKAETERSLTRVSIVLGTKSTMKSQTSQSVLTSLPPLLCRYLFQLLI